MVAVRHREELDREMAEALLEEARRRDWALLDLNLTTGVLADLPVPAGAIVTWLPTDPIPTQFRGMGVPTVRLGRRDHPDDTPATPAAFPDYRREGWMVAEYFAHRRFRHLACVMHEGFQIMHLVYDAMRERGEQLGCVCHAHEFHSIGDPHADDAARLEHQAQRMRNIAAWLVGLPKPVGVLAHGDAMAAQLGVLCQQAGLAVPENVALIGRGNSEVWCEMALVPISSVDTNRRGLTRATMGVLDTMMRGQTPPARTVVPPRGIVTRRSTDILAVADPMVVRAIRFIWDHLDRDLAVDEVAAAMGLPRYRLERAFRRHLGRGVKAEHVRARMERCCELLRSTTLPITELAPRVGFRTPEYLHNTFRKTYGISPRRYRMRMTRPDEPASPNAG